MSEVSIQPLCAQPLPEADNQFRVAITTVFVLGLLGGGLIAAGVMLKTSEAWVAIGGIIGILGNSLNAPTGIGNVLAKAGVNKSNIQA